MKQHLQNVLGKLSSQVSLQTLLAVTNKQVLLPFYHTVSDARLPHICNLYKLRGTKQFMQDLDFMLKHYRPVCLSELHTLIQSGQKSTKPVFHLTFDDGLKELYTVIAPILEQKGIPATIFLNTAFIDNRALFYRYKVSLLVEQLKFDITAARQTQLARLLGTTATDEYTLSQHLMRTTYQGQHVLNEVADVLDIDFDVFLQTQQPYLSTAEVKSLLKRGFTMGSHSVDHPLFKNLAPNEQKKQITESFATLEQEFGITDRYFSFPFHDGGVRLEFLNWLHNEANCNLTFGISGLKNDFSPRHLHRIPIEGSHKPIEQLIKREYLYFLLKGPLLQNKIYRQ